MMLRHAKIEKEKKVRKRIKAKKGRVKTPENKGPKGYCIVKNNCRLLVNEKLFSMRYSYPILWKALQTILFIVKI